MKMKQAGLTSKPMYVVPNHLLEQFSREFLQLYPNAKLLVAAKEDFTRERRKFLTARIASGEWDGIVVTHSSLKLASQYPRIQAGTGISPACTLQARGRSSLHVIGRDGVSG
jgi:N12 class adenine-specific DNA methylase